MWVCPAGTGGNHIPVPTGGNRSDLFSFLFLGKKFPFIFLQCTHEMNDDGSRRRTSLGGRSCSTQNGSHREDPFVWASRSFYFGELLYVWLVGRPVVGWVEVQPKCHPRPRSGGRSINDIFCRVLGRPELSFPWRRVEEQRSINPRRSHFITLTAVPCTSQLRCLFKFFPRIKSSFNHGTIVGVLSSTIQLKTE